MVKLSISTKREEDADVTVSVAWKINGTVEAGTTGTLELPDGLVVTEGQSGDIVVDGSLLEDAPSIFDDQSVEPGEEEIEEVEEEEETNELINEQKVVEDVQIGQFNVSEDGNLSVAISRNVDLEVHGDIVLNAILEGHKNKGMFFMSANSNNVPFNSGSEITENFEINSVRMFTNPDENGKKTGDSEEIPDFRPSTDESLSIEFNWELDGGHNYSAGDFYTFDLPDVFLFGDEDLTGELTNEEGVPVADYLVTTEGKVTFTFNDQINEGKGYEGDFFVWKKFDKSKLKEGTKQDIKFEIDGDSIAIPVHFKKDEGNNINKNGTPKKDDVENNRNSDSIEWIVDFNLDEKSLNGVTLIDTLPAGLIIVDTSIEIYELTVNLDGTVNYDVVEDKVTDKTPVIDGQLLEIDFGKIDGAYRVIYQTSVPTPSGENPDYNPRYENQVEITNKDNNETLKDNDSVNISFNEPLNKNSIGYIKENQEIRWEIEYNFNEQSIDKDDAVLIDTFNIEHQELDIGSFEVFKVDIDPSGKPVNEEQVDSLKYNVVDFTDPNDLSVGGFEFSFTEDIDSAFIIKYKTTATERVYEDSFKVNNKVEIEDGPEKDAEQEIHQVIFDKNNGKIDYENKIITWTITVNQDGYDMTNVVITDSFRDQGLTFVENSLETNPNLSANLGYELNVDSDEEGFELKLGNIEEKLVITYQTAFDPTHFDFENVQTANYKNEATLDWDEIDDSKPDMIKTGTLTPNDLMKHNGAKTAEYDATEKVITWTIDINYNRHTINQPVVTDFYSGEQNFDANSLKVERLQINSDGTVEVIDNSEFENFDLDSEVTDNNRNGFKLTFNEGISEPYRITYQTNLKGLPVEEEYNNKATLFNAEEPGNILLERDAKVRPKFGDKNSHKEVSQDGRTANWILNINRNKSFIEDAIVIDELSDNQFYYQDSFVLYETIVDEEGNITQGNPVDESQYDLKFSVDTDTWKESFKLDFDGSIEEAYILTYDTYINAKNGEEISNNAFLYETGEDDANDEASQEYEVSFQGGAGGSVFSTGGMKFSIKKVDADNSMPLKDAKFELYDVTGVNLLETITTDDNGVATTEGEYKFGKYLIKEIEAPEGYFISDEYEQGKVIIFDKDSNDDSIIYEVDDNEEKIDEPYTFTNTEGKWDVKLLKIDSVTNDELSGATFELYDVRNLNDPIEINGETQIETNQDGEIFLENLEPGDYQFVEIEAPYGYLLDDEPIEFTIKEKPVELERLDFKNTAIERIEISGEKQWIEADDQYRPGSIVVHLLRDGEEFEKQIVKPNDSGEWKYSFTDLLATDPSGETYDYTVKEIEVPGYETEVLENNIYNTQNTTEIFGSKTWLDNDDATGDRPDSITVQVLKDTEVIQEKEVEVDQYGDWTYTFTNLPTHDQYGEEIEYKINELPVPGYSTEYDGNDIINTRTDIIDVAGTKTWHEVDKRYRPDSITVQLLANGEVEKEQQVTAKTDWNYGFYELPAYDEDGIAIVYGIAEVPLPGYETEVNGYDMTNTQLTKDITVTKTWKGDNEEIRPNSITLHLYADGVKVDTIKMTEETGWKYTFEQSPVYNENSEEIEYTIEEDPVNQYETTINGFDITNTFTPDKTDSEIPKTATPYYNMLLIGMLIMAFGALIFVWYRTRRRA